MMTRDKPVDYDQIDSDREPLEVMRRHPGDVRDLRNGPAEDEGEESEPWIQVQYICLAIDGRNERKGGGLEGQTKCHHCKRTGHWKGECPLRKSGKPSSSDASKEVHVVDFIDSESESFEVYQVEVPAEKEEKAGKVMKGKKMKDEWQVTPEALIRLHHRGRKGVFTPTGMNDVPMS